MEHWAVAAPSTGAAGTLGALRRHTGGKTSNSSSQVKARAP